MLKTVDMDRGLKILDSHCSFNVHHSFVDRALSWTHTEPFPA
jgi:hypothetical protein